MPSRGGRTRSALRVPLARKPASPRRGGGHHFAAAERIARASLGFRNLLADDDLRVHELEKRLLGERTGFARLVAQRHERALLLHELEHADGRLLLRGISLFGS